MTSKYHMLQSLSTLGFVFGHEFLLLETAWIFRKSFDQSPQKLYNLTQLTFSPMKQKPMARVHLHAKSVAWIC